MKQYIKAIGVDFDGVIHSYERGWQGGVIYGTPIEGAIDSVKTIMEKYAVFIYTARNNLEDVALWLNENGGFECVTSYNNTFWDVKGKLLITNKKYTAIAYIDDRAITFTDWGNTMEAVERLY